CGLHPSVPTSTTTSTASSSRRPRPPSRRINTPEGRAGAVAIAVAAAVAQQIADGVRQRDGVALVEEVRRRTPRGQVRDGVANAQSLLHLDDPRSAARVLGNGSAVSAPDTVPFCLWVIAHHLDDYEQALWTTVAALGDRDT